MKIKLNSTSGLLAIPWESLFLNKKKKAKRRMKKIIKKINDFEMERLKTPMILLLLIFLMLMVVYVQSFKKQNAQKLSYPIVPESKIALQKKIENLTSGHPIENMAAYISQKDEKVAKLMVAIAKKESNWGERAPVLHGENCFNYWGYRGLRDRMGSGGHTCFDSPRDAVNTVSRRLAYLVYEEGMDTPDKLTYWKCGNACQDDNRADVEKWAADVALYYEKVDK